MTETLERATRLVFPGEAWPKLRDALQHIADHPAEFYMFRYIVDLEDETAVMLRAIKATTHLPLPACGIVACLAGRIILQSDRATEGPPNFAALRILGLDASEMDEDGFLDPVSDALDQVFRRTYISTYAQLAAHLNELFTFPAALPEGGAL